MRAVGAPRPLFSAERLAILPFRATCEAAGSQVSESIQKVAAVCTAKLQNLPDQDAAAAGETTMNFIRFGDSDSDAEKSSSERCRIPRSASSSFFFSSLARSNSTWATFITAQHEVGTQHGLGSNFELVHYDVSCK